MSEQDYLLYVGYCRTIVLSIAAIFVVYGSVLLYSKTDLPGSKILFYASVFAVVLFLIDVFSAYVVWPDYMEAFYMYLMPLVVGINAFVFGLGFLRLCLHMARNKIIINQNH